MSLPARPRNPHVMIAEAQEIYWLQTHMCVEAKQGRRRRDRDFLEAYLILGEMHTEIMRVALELMARK